MIIIGCPLSNLQLFTVQAVYTCSVLSNLSVKNNTKMIKMNDYQIRDSDQPPGHSFSLIGFTVHKGNLPTEHTAKTLKNTLIC